MSSIAENKALIRRWFDEVWNQGRADLIDELRAPETVATGLGDSQQKRGPEPFKAFYVNMRRAFPDLRMTIEDMIGEGDKVALRVVMHGTHTGDSLGVAPTNKPVVFHAILFVRIGDGKIAEAWNNMDFLGLLRQIGAVSDPLGSERFLRVSEDKPQAPR